MPNDNDKDEKQIFLKVGLSEYQNYNQRLGQTFSGLISRDEKFEFTKRIFTKY